MTSAPRPKPRVPAHGVCQLELGPLSCAARRRLVLGGLCSLAATTLWPCEARADAVAVPELLQSKLLAKVAKYDRNLQKRISGNVKVMVLEKPGTNESALTAGKLTRALGQVGQIAGRNADIETHGFTNSAKLAETCRATSPAIIYVTPGLGEQMSAIANSLTGISVLTVSAVAQYVESGAVLGFDLIEGKPKIVIHLRQAKAQQVSFIPAFLRLAKIVAR